MIFQVTIFSILHSPPVKQQTNKNLPSGIGFPDVCRLQYKLPRFCHICGYSAKWLTSFISDSCVVLVWFYSTLCYFHHIVFAIYLVCYLLFCWIIRAVFSLGPSFFFFCLDPREGILFLSFLIGEQSYNFVPSTNPWILQRGLTLDHNR